tara:strand:+ start:50 stop:694 length:645 start_codon:yes stop_codon:yes gene_type:complete
MDEEITIINANTRNEKFRNFIINNKKNFFIIISIILILLIGYLSFEEVKKRNKIKIADQFNTVMINYKVEKKDKIIIDLITIVNKQDATYSPLALYFLIDNDLIEKKNEINKLFDVLINEIKLEKEIKNLIIYKKALYNSGHVNENELIKILNPLINSKSIWKSHALYLLAEYFYSKNEKEKAKEFFNQVLILQNINSDIKLETQKRLNRDLSE